MLRLGSRYGGWYLVDDPSLQGATVISAGLGEDASFDLAFAARYGGRVIIIDPTPRAIQHFERLIDRINGRMVHDSVAHYDISGVGADQLTLVPKALWSRAETIRLYAPKDPRHVSHSIVDFQNSYKQDGAFIEVPSVTIAGLMSEHGLAKLPLIKMDIEGAEIEVVASMCSSGTLPLQLLVEYDELLVRSGQAKERFFSAHEALIRAGLKLHRRQGANYSYSRLPE